MHLNNIILCYNYFIFKVFDKVKVRISLDVSKKHAPRVVYESISPLLADALSIDTNSNNSDNMILSSDPEARKRVAEAQLLRKELKKARKD